MKELLTSKQLANKYAESCLWAAELAQALKANYADVNQIKRFELAADRCATLNQLYATIHMRKGWPNNL